MAAKNGFGDFSAGLLPIDVRVATFLAEIQADTQGNTRTNDNQIKVLLDQQGCPERDSTDQDAMELEDNVLCSKKTKSSANKNTKSSGVRKHRYRDDKQKLSNSMAQKRYRERKKRAFDELKSLVDCLTLELQQLRHVKAENQRLTITLEEYKQILQMHETNDKEKSSMSDHDVLTEVLVCSSPVSMTNSAQTGRAPPISAPVPAPTLTPASSMTVGTISQQLLNDLELMGPVGVMKHICSRGNITQLDSSSSMATRVEFLTKEWDGRMSAVEQFLKFQRTCGATALGVSPNNLQSVMKDSMTKMFSLHSELASAKLLCLSEEIQKNNNRITEAFTDFIDNNASK
eukprot:g1054.t1